MGGSCALIEQVQSPTVARIGLQPLQILAPWGTCLPDVLQIVSRQNTLFYRKVEPWHIFTVNGQILSAASQTGAGIVLTVSFQDKFELNLSTESTHVSWRAESAERFFYLHGWRPPQNEIRASILNRKQSALK